jgi:hypothetical protein
MVHHGHVITEIELPFLMQRIEALDYENTSS